jgi:amino acid transporter
MLTVRSRAGPGSILISYAFMGFIVYLVMCGLGEMATWLPRSSGFTGYAVRFCDPALGFALGYTYVAICSMWTINR